MTSFGHFESDAKEGSSSEDDDEDLHGDDVYSEDYQIESGNS
jgi:hypothetical protein